MTALNNYRSAKEAGAGERAHRREDARDLVVLAVGGAYLQAVAARARVESARAQMETATALYKQTSNAARAGLLAQIDVNRSQVQQQTQQQRLATLENDFAKQKINLARLTGLPANDKYELTDEVPFAEAPPISAEEALQRGARQPRRSESRARRRCAQRSGRGRPRARNGCPRWRYRRTTERSALILRNRTAPSLSPGHCGSRFGKGAGPRATLSRLRPSLDQRRAELEDTRGRIESDVRNALLDLQAAANQMEVSRNNQRGGAGDAGTDAAELRGGRDRFRGSGAIEEGVGHGGSRLHHQPVRAQSGQAQSRARDRPRRSKPSPVSEGAVIGFRI